VSVASIGPPVIDCLVDPAFVNGDEMGIMLTTWKLEKGERMFGGNTVGNKWVWGWWGEERARERRISSVR
jgi:hypothetical protein